MWMWFLVVVCCSHVQQCFYRLRYFAITEAISNCSGLWNYYPCKPKAQTETMSHAMHHSHPISNRHKYLNIMTTMMQIPILYRLRQSGFTARIWRKLVRIQVRLVAYQQAFRHVHYSDSSYSRKGVHRLYLKKQFFVGVFIDFNITLFIAYKKCHILNFYYSLYGLRCFSFGFRFCRFRKKWCRSLHSLAPIVVTAQDAKTAWLLKLTLSSQFSQYPPLRLFTKYYGF